MLRTLSGLLFALAAIAPSLALPLQLQLPTDNDALFSTNLEKFYMYTTRNFEGKASTPWEAGQYGYFRNLKRTPEGVIGTRFHEGIDIRPVRRDATGRPLDEVRSIAVGNVVYANNNAGGSNYGKYVVIKHMWDDCPYFSLYAHLAEIDVTPGQRVLRGFKIGKMGYTGAGITRERAHLHLELNMLMSLRFDDWHKSVYAEKNPHGLHNGLNLCGLDIPSLFLALEKDPELSIPGFLKRTPTYFKVTSPRRGPLEIVERYPWLRAGDHARPSPSWEISFSPSGLPLAVAPSHRQVAKPLVTWARNTRSDHGYYTRSRLTGKGNRASLTQSGLRYVSLVTSDFPSGDDARKPKP